MEALEAAQGWLSRNTPWLGFVLLAVLGGVVAHIREWESTHPGYTYSQHAWSLFRRSVMSVLAGLMWWLLMRENGWESRPYAYVGASLVGLFTPEFFDLLWGVFKARFSATAGKKP